MEWSGNGKKVSHVGVEGYKRIRFAVKLSTIRFHVSTGLGTMLFGVSGKCDEREFTSLPDEFPKEPVSEKET